MPEDSQERVSCRLLTQAASSAAWRMYFMTEPPEQWKLGAQAFVDCSYKLHKIAFFKKIVF